tara:strand:+ start:62 stop:238 length:177 start_codon:yes stop_codon:yes gene_type:complete
MDIKQLIEKLQQLERDHGDIPVMITDYENCVFPLELDCMTVKDKCPVRGMVKHLLLEG